MEAPLNTAEFSRMEEYYAEQLRAEKNGPAATLSFALPPLQALPMEHQDPESTMMDDAEDDPDETDSPIPFAAHIQGQTDGPAALRAHLAALKASGTPFSIHPVDEWVDMQKQNHPMITSVRDSLALPQERALFENLVHSDEIKSFLQQQDYAGLSSHLEAETVTIRELATTMAAYEENPVFQAALAECSCEEDCQCLRGYLAEHIRVEGVPTEGFWKDVKRKAWKTFNRKSYKKYQKMKHPEKEGGEEEKLASSMAAEGGPEDQEWTETRNTIVNTPVPAAQSPVELARLAAVPVDGLLHAGKQGFRRLKQTLGKSQEAVTMYPGNQMDGTYNLNNSLQQFVTDLDRTGKLSSLGAKSAADRNLHVYLEYHRDKKVAAVNLLRNEQSFTSQVYDIQGGFKAEIYTVASSGSVKPLTKGGLLENMGQGRVSGRQLDIGLGLGRRVYVRPVFETTPADEAFTSCVWFAQGKKAKNPDVFCFLFENNKKSSDRLLKWIAVWSEDNFKQRTPLQTLAQFLNDAIQTEETLKLAQQVFEQMMTLPLDAQHASAEKVSQFNLFIASVLTRFMPLASQSLASLAPGHGATLATTAPSLSSAAALRQAQEIRNAILLVAENSTEDLNYWFSDLTLMSELRNNSDAALSLLSQFLHASVALLSDPSDAEARVVHVWQHPKSGLSRIQ